MKYLKMKNTFMNWSVLTLMICVSWACQNSKKATAEKLVKEWINREVVFPEGIPCSYMGIDTICPNSDALFKILVYTDSVGCTSCKLNLNLWKHYREEIDSIAPRQIDFLFYFQPKSAKELAYLLKRERMEDIVFADNRGILDKANDFPEGMEYQCFLLDKNNRVVSIGNPTLNPKIWEVYKQVITDTKE